MFTGIIEEIGTVKQIRQGTASAVLNIRAERVLEGTKVGDSIAVNGICLTVTSLFPDAFTADVMHETLNRAAMSGLDCQKRVNLERAMQINGRFNGHMVAGHIDGTGKIIHIHRDDTAVWFTIQTKPEIMRYIVEKGSVAIDGISLTAVNIKKTGFSVSAIPHTVRQTILQDLKEGELVNLETDLMGKYAGKFLFPSAEQQKGHRITKEFLTNCGF